MLSQKLKHVLLGSAGVAVIAALASGILIWRNAQHALRDSEAEITTASRNLFQLNAIQAPSIPAGFHSFNTANGFQSFASYDGQIFVNTRSALYRYDSSGQLRQTWYVGQDLPPFPLVSLAVRRGIAQPELWVATNGAGVLIWNGSLVRQLDAKDPALREVTALLPLANGRMLIGTLNSGLYVTDTRQHSLFHPEFAGAAITALASSGGSEDQLWVGTRDAGVWLWQGGTVSRFRDELPDLQVLSLCSSGDKVWVGTPTGIAEFSDAHFQRSLAEGVFARSLAASGDTLWISTIEDGTLSLNLKAHGPRPSANTRGALESISLQTVDGKLLALTPDALRTFPENEEILHAPVGLTAGHIAALHSDGENLWIGYFDRGLDVLPLAAESSPRHLENDVLFCVNRIKQDPATRRIYVATANGLAIFDASGQTRQILRTRDGLLSNHVTDLLFRPSEPGRSQVVVATPAGLSFVDGASVSSLYAFQGLVNNHVYTLAQSSDALLAGTLGGVSALKNGLIQASFTTANSSLQQNWITASAAQGDDVYLGTYGSGVVRVDKNFTIQTFREFSGQRTEINQNAMLMTDHAVYAGTAGRGLAVLSFSDHRWRFFYSGLPSMNVTALAKDGQFLYIGTDNGLVRIPEANLSL